MAKYTIILDGVAWDVVFCIEEVAEKYALYLRSWAKIGAETLQSSNPDELCL